MARTDYSLEALQSDKRTGNYTVRELARKHGVSVATVHKHTAHLPNDLAPLVNKNIEIKQELNSLSEQELTSVHLVVDERTKHLQFFNNATLKNLSVMVKKIDEDTTFQDHKMAQDAIARGKETVIGKAPDTAIQINNNVATQQAKDLTDDQLAAIIARGGN